MLIKSVSALKRGVNLAMHRPTQRRTRRKAKPGESFSVRRRLFWRKPPFLRQSPTIVRARPNAVNLSRQQIRGSLESVAIKLHHPDEQKLAATPAEQLEIDQNQCWLSGECHNFSRSRAAKPEVLAESRAEWDYGFRIHPTPMKSATARALVPWPLFIPQW